MSNKMLLDNTFTTLLERVKPESLLLENSEFKNGILRINEYSVDLTKYKNVYLLGSGKAVVPMTKAIESLLASKINESLIVGPYTLNEPLQNCTYIKSTHPIPSLKSVEAAVAMKSKIEAFTQDDFFIYLLSGGTSSLLELPQEGISLEDMQKATSLMLKKAMPIEHINAVRKHLSQVKGGMLVQNVKAKGLVLVLSDVIGNDLHAIGSAPLYYDTSTFTDVYNYLLDYDLFEKMPKSIQDYITQNLDSLEKETPNKPSSNIEHSIVGSNEMVLLQAKRLLEQRGIACSVMPEPIQGDVLVAARTILDFIEQYRGDKHAFVWGGEVTVEVCGNGKGGRNQHLALLLLEALDADIDVTILCAASDGVDGNSNAAGALIDNHSVIKAKNEGIDATHYIETFNSNAFFELTKELVISGPTHNNLLDIVVVILEKRD